MSSIFDLPERVQRLRQMFSFFRDAALSTGAEVRDSAEAGLGGEAHDEWLQLLSDIRDWAEPVVQDGEPAKALLLAEEAHRAFMRSTPALTVH